ncbi:MAG: FKBP-type peptidyl-prolyl cis-trans isomerase [Saprospiraceae bacterium]|nr:FKBP-type peptidyl-prolyl cis-trans isomerase [Saprospiraceae bacterium]
MKNLKHLFLLLVLVTIAAACKKSKTPSGYAYTIHKKGDGAMAKIGDAAFYDVILYKDDSLIFSTIKEGQEARSRVEDPKTAPDPFYKLTQEALLLLKVGDSATFIMPLDTFKVKPQGLENAKQAKLTMILRKVKSKDELDKRQSELKVLAESIQAAGPSFKARAKAVGDSTSTFAKDFAAGKLPAGIKELPSGLKIAILREGTGAMPKKGEVVLVNYCGATKDGNKFDESFPRGEPINFPIGVGQVIPGWDEGLMNLKEGTTAVLFIPSALGYGERAAGKIPANSDLVFYVELLKSVDVQ